MTDSYSNNQVIRSESGIESVAANAPNPFLFKDNPISFEVVANNNTSGPYYYDANRNSWIFYIPGTELPGPPLDPSGGNIWIDPNNAYLMYVYNAGELITEDNPDISADAWVALTTNKRAYDYLIVPYGEEDSDVDFSPLKIDLYKQTVVYFNTQDLDLKIRVGEDWQSIKQSGIDAVTDPDEIINDAIPPTQLRVLQNSIESLQQRVNDLASQIGAPVGLPTQVDPGPIAVSGYYPLYTTSAGAEAAGDGTYHTHDFNSITYYMPNGVTFYHGDYGSTPGPTPTPDPTPTPTPTPTPGPSPSPGDSGGYGY